jgi:alkylation response protein AidB-like acyl-CoA dehydrogenase
MNQQQSPFRRVVEQLPQLAYSLHHGCRDQEELDLLQAIRHSLQRFAARHIDSERLENEGRLSQELLRQLGELGLFGLAVPREYGGSGLSMCAVAQVISWLGALDGSLAVTVGLHNGLGLRGLLHYGPPELKNRYLPGLAQGKPVAAFAVTEEGAGSDLGAVRTSARLENGKLIIEGSKCYITNAGLAGLVTILARSGELGGVRRGFSLVLVPMNLPGVELGAEEHKMGIRASSTRALYFNSVSVPADHLLPPAGRGMDQLGHILSWGRTFMAAGACGVAARALEKSVSYALERRQFGRSLAEFGQVRALLSRISALSFGMESLVRLTTALEDLEPKSIGWESAAAKVACSEGVWQAADDALQIHGGAGYLTRTGIERLLRDSRISRIFEGANEVLRIYLSAPLWLWHNDTPKLVDRIHPALGALAGRFDRNLCRLFDFCSRRRRELGVKIFRRQLENSRAADAAVALLMQLAVLARAHAGARPEGEDTARLFAEWLEHEVEDRLARLESPSACERDELLARLAAHLCSRAGGELQEEGR